MTLAVKVALNPNTTTTHEKIYLKLAEHRSHVDFIHGETVITYKFTGVSRTGSTSSQGQSHVFYATMSYLGFK